MLGPLPTKYRLVVSLCALVAFIGVGAWFSYSLHGPVLATTGAGVGAALGAVATLLLLHDFRAHPGGARVATRRGQRLR